MTWLHFLLLLLHAHTCVASEFGWKSDPLRGGPAACLRRPLRPGELGVAHRFLPCGARVLVLNPRTWEFVVAPVVDHGPYGAMSDGEWVIKRHREDPGEWRGCLDLSRGAAGAIEHDGMRSVIWAVVNP